MPEAGTGMRIAILDSGVRASALRLASNSAVVGRSFVNGVPEWEDWDGHGTQCASRLIDLELGAAPGAQLTALRVRRGAHATLESLELAISWLLSQSREHPWDLVLFGVGLPARSRNDDPFPELERLTHELDALGTLLVAPSGNRTSRQPRYVDHPARYASVLSVGALVAGEGGGSWAGSCDLGHGEQTVDTWVEGCDVPVRQLAGSVARVTGTSFAAANAVALLARYLEQRRDSRGPVSRNAAQTIRAELVSQPGQDSAVYLQPAILRALSGEGLCARSA